MEISSLRCFFLNSNLAQPISDGSRANIGQLVTLHGEVQHGRSHPLMEQLSTACVVCNDSVPSYGKKRTLGSPTEAALMGFAQKLGLEDLRNDWKRIEEVIMYWFFRRAKFNSTSFFKSFGNSNKT